MPSLPEPEARHRLTVARSGYLATASPDGAPHVVPMTFAVVDTAADTTVDTAVGTTIYSAVDAKPKRSPRLRRLANVAANPAASVLVDAWDEDWSQLWWVRADGRGRLVGVGAERERAVAALRAKYAQYLDHTLDSAVLAIEVDRINGWTAQL